LSLETGTFSGMFLKGSGIGKALPFAATTLQCHKNTNTDECEDGEKGLEGNATPLHQ
jgi:hypothetical protein